jgi:hypothetical protein
VVYDSITVETPPEDLDVGEDSSFDEHTDEDVLIRDEFGEDDLHEGKMIEDR